MKKPIILSSIFLLMISSVFISCNDDIKDMPQNTIIGKWQYSHLIEYSADAKYEETVEAINKDLKNRWETVEAGAFTYDFTSDKKVLYNNEFKGMYTFTGSGLVITNKENDKYVDEGSLQFSIVDEQLIVLHNLASEYRDENNQYANIELLKSLGVTISLDITQPIYGAWVKLSFTKVK